MKTTLLLPNGFKKIGWVIFIPSFILGCIIVFSLSGSGLNLPFSEELLNNIAIIGTILGALLIGFSREKIEDEMIQRIRLHALMSAMWINYLILIALSLAIYNLNYLIVMSASIATPLVIFLIVYYASLYRLNRSSRHEE